MLRPLRLHLVVGHTAIEHDPSLPRVVLNGELAELRVELSDALVRDTMALLNSVQ